MTELLIIGAFFVLGVGSIFVYGYIESRGRRNEARRFFERLD